MIIVYQGTPASVLKAAMLSRLNKGLCVKNAPPSGLLCAEETVNCKEYSLQAVKTMYSRVFPSCSWMDGSRGKELAAALHYALRYKGSDCPELALKVVTQALEHGPDYVLSRISKEARTMFNRARRVTVEIHRAFGFVRLIPVDTENGLNMAAYVHFEHNIHDEVIRYFSRKQKNTVIYLIDGGNAYFMCGNIMKVTPVETLRFSLPVNDFQDYWEAYYDSQFIAGRKNTPLARKHIPQKLWSWVPEGEKLK